GNILIYLSLTRHLLDGVSVYGLQSPGLDGHKRPLRTIEEMAVSYVDEITRRQPVGPYVLAGYCMGGKIALEMARVLNERGQSVAMLAMLDTFNVNLANAANFRTSKLSYVCQMIMFHASNLFAHGPQESWLYLREKVRQAMLVEPFVQKPAAEINIRLCDLFKLRPSDDGNRAKPGVAHPTSHT